MEDLGVKACSVAEIFPHFGNTRLDVGNPFRRVKIVIGCLLGSIMVPSAATWVGVLNSIEGGGVVSPAVEDEDVILDGRNCKRMFFFWWRKKSEGGASRRGFSINYSVNLDYSHSLGWPWAGTDGVRK